jgi:DNA-binding transcriptional MocR family regulator
MHMTPRALVRALGDWRGRDRPLATSLADALAAALLDGRLSPGVRLPAERVLAAELAVSRTTITSAYRRLTDHGFAASRQGSGTVTRLPATALADPRSWAALASVQPAWPAPIASAAAAYGPASTPPEPIGAAARGPASSPAIDLTVAAPPASALVLDIIAGGIATGLSGHVHSLGYNALGLPGVRAAIAERFSAGGLPTSGDQILVTAGAQQALDLVARSLLGRARPVLVESPTYPGTLEALRAQRARLVSLPVRDDGWDADELTSLARQTGAAAAFLTPDHHNPTGRVMSDEQRGAVVRAAGQAGLALVVDETMRELWLDGPPPPHLARHGQPDEIVTIGSLSKAAWAGLRIGWIRATPQRVARLAELRLASDLGGSIVEQVAAGAVLGRLDEVLAALRGRLARQRDALREALREHAAIAAPPPPGGMCLWLQLASASTTDLALAAPGHGLRLVAGPRFSPDGALDHYLRLPYTLPADTLREAAGRLARLLEAARGAPEILVSV